MRTATSRIAAGLIDGCAARGAWHELFPLAQRHKLAGVVAHALRAGRSDAPAAIAAEAERVLERARHQAARLVPELAGVVEALRVAGVPALAVKGPAQSALLYGDPDLRSSLDLDLLIARRDLRSAAACLERLGYAARPRADGLAREIHFVNPRRGFVVDLHWNIVGGDIPFPLDFATLWAERQAVALGGGTIDVPGTAWLTVLSGLYLVKEYPWVDLTYLADLEQLARRVTLADLACVGEIATATGTRRITALAFTLLRRYGIDTRAPVAGDAAVERLADRLERALADPHHRRKRLYWHRLATLLSHVAFRERIADRLRVIAALPAFLLLPDMNDAERAAAEGRSLWAARLRRLPEVAATLLAARPGAWTAWRTPSPIRGPGSSRRRASSSSCSTMPGSCSTRPARSCSPCRRPRPSSGAHSWRA
ncbi:nucleotidyltransferase family protein [Benzoatithermus flavus]|uniref:Nucleotidyltransferase family protein n=1 Tax=Benzoatithermus flavus TaxID=3108223 RepID=A0ABU8XTP1_9PROT